ncbi:hypothetical protein PVAND_017725, partial [Polypedilum vanderplanki]
NIDQGRRSGTCKSCQKIVPWSRDRVAAHKRATCPYATAEEKKYFAKRKHESSSSSSSNNQQQIDLSESFIQNDNTINDETKNDIDMKLANFFYRSGISFRLIESAAFKDFVEALNPTYAALLPNAKSLSGSLLDKQYTKCLTSMNDILDSHNNLTLITDGWTNVRGDHIVNYCIKSPNEKPLFYTSVNTSGTVQNASAVASSIIEVLESLGPEKFNSIISDNAPVMKAAWKIVEEKFPHISANGCSAHGVNLPVKDILSTPEASKTIKEAEKIIKFVRNHHIVKAKFDERRSAANIPHSLSMPVPTRWFSYFTSMSSLQNSKYALIKLADEEYDLLKEIQPKTTSAAVLNLIKSNVFWDRLIKVVKNIEFPSNIIGKLENDEASLSVVYEYFGKLYKFFEDDENIQKKVKARLDFLRTPSVGLSYILKPKNAAEGFYLGEDKTDFIAEALDFAEKMNPDFAFIIQDELINFLGDMASLPEKRKELIFKMTAKNYWNIIGHEKYPALSRIAKPLNEMISSSSAAERTWSTFSFIHSRLRNRLTNERVKKLVFLYTNSVLMDEKDKNDYILEEGAVLNEVECDEINESM